VVFQLGLFGIVVVVVVLKSSFKKMFFVRFVLILTCFVKTVVEIMVEKKTMCCVWLICFLYEV
jgi:hypothetical protein